MTAKLQPGPQKLKPAPALAPGPDFVLVICAPPPTLRTDFVRQVAGGTFPISSPIFFALRG